VVIAWSLAVYYVALAMRLEPNGVSEEVAKDAHQLRDLDELTTAWDRTTQWMRGAPGLPDPRIVRLRLVRARRG
jgi:hypothetical protein